VELVLTEQSQELWQDLSEVWTNRFHLGSLVPLLSTVFYQTLGEVLIEFEDDYPEVFSVCPDASCPFIGNEVHETRNLHCRAPLLLDAELLPLGDVDSTSLRGTQQLLLTLQYLL
jgi:hypothetical protein